MTLKPGLGGHSKSLEITSFDVLYNVQYMTYYLCSIVTIKMSVKWYNVSKKAKAIITNHSDVKLEELQEYKILRIATAS